MYELVSRTLEHPWRYTGLRGIVGILFGAVAMFWTDVTIRALVLLFGVCAIADGIVSLVAAARRPSGERGWLTSAGVAGIALGVVTFAWPSITTAGLAVLIGAWFTVTGLGHVGAAAGAPRRTPGRWLLACGGLLGTLFGLYLVAFPGRGATAGVTAIGLVAVGRGITLLVTAVASRRELDDVAGPFSQAAVR